MDKWPVEKAKARMKDVLSTRVHESEIGCLIHEKKGHKTKKNGVDKGYVKAKFNGSKTDVYLHHLAVVAAGRDVSAFMDGNHEFSHLCHHPKCINEAHILLETKAENASRSICKGWTWIRRVPEEPWFNPCQHKPQCVIPMHPDQRAEKEKQDNIRPFKQHKY